MARDDVITLGETMLCFTPPGWQRLEQTTCLDLEVGGTESNLAIGLARLGLNVLWLSRLTTNPLGRIIARGEGCSYRWRKKRYKEKSLSVPDINSGLCGKRGLQSSSQRRA